jgi:hypothetical protein
MIKRKLIILPVLALSLFVGGLTCGGSAQAGQIGDGSGDYIYAFPRDPLASTVRNMLLHSCAPITIRRWICPDAPPYVYGS